MSVFQKLFEPISIGSMELKNRAVMAPMATHFAGLNGEATQCLIDYYAERARGGVGLIISESNYVQIKGRGGRNRFGLYDDRLLEGHARLVEAVHDGVFAALEGVYPEAGREGRLFEESQHGFEVRSFPIRLALLQPAAQVLVLVL